jgi:acetyltransferase-like isoleucine patch superfamily enzyme
MRKTGLLHDKFRQERFFGIVLKGIANAGYFINYVCLKLLCRKVGKSVKVLSVPSITGGRNIVIGDNVFIGRDVHFSASNDSFITIGHNVEIRDGVRVYAGNIVIEPQVTVGEFTFLGGQIHLHQGCWVSRGCDVSGEVEVGNAILGPYACCISADHARAQDGAVCMDTHSTLGKISIEDGAWIGMNSTILKGVTIKKNAIVGAGAVVTKSVAQGKVVAGVPAKEIHSTLSIE